MIVRLRFYFASAVNGLLAALFLTLITTASVAQAPNPDHPDDYPRLFPSPTGRNGYEDFVLAEDAIRKSAAWIAYEKRAESAPATLTEKRALLADNRVREALLCLRRGLEKPVQPPAESDSESARFSEIGGFRALGRLLCVDMYVCLSEGKVNDAIGCLRDGLRFAYALQTGNVIGGLSAIVIDEACVKLFAEHLDQMSARDCEHLVKLVQEWMKAADPALLLLSADHDRTVKKLEKYRSDPVSTLLALSNSLSGTNGDSKHLKEIADGGSGDVLAARSLIDAAESIASARLESDAAEFKKPYWQRKMPGNHPDPETRTSAEAVADDLFGHDRLLRLAEWYSRDLAMLQLLGVHSAIRRFRWEFDRLPTNLSELKIGDLAVDPFSGKPLVFERIDSLNINLSSVGPYDRGANGQRPSGKRIPIVLPVPREE